MAKKHMIQRGYQGRLEDAYSTLENEDKLDSEEYQDKPKTPQMQAFGKRRDKMNKPQRGGIRE